MDEVDGSTITVQNEAELSELVAAAEREEMIAYLHDAKADAGPVPARAFLESLGKCQS